MLNKSHLDKPETDPISLHLDQSRQQTITGGAPNFQGGIIASNYFFPWVGEFMDERQVFIKSDGTLGFYYANGGLETEKHTIIDLFNENISLNGTISASNLSGTNTGDQDLSSYIKKDGSVDFTGEPSFKAIFTAGENLVAGNVCYLKSDGKFWKAKGDAEATTKGRLLIALASISANATGLFLIRGYYTDSGLTAGGTYFISTSTAGAKATTAPSSGNFARVVGWAMSTTSFYFDPSKDYIEVS